MIEPPHVVSLVLLLPLATLFAVFLATKVRGHDLPRWKLAVPVLFVTIPCLVVVATAYKRRTFAWSDAGIEDHAFGDVSLRWSDVEEVRRVPDVWASEWGPALRTDGMAYGVYRAGRFRLRNGASARVFMMTTAREAFVFRTRRGTYVYAPMPFEGFAAVVTTKLRS